jgi:hypothetical protein
MHVIASTFGDWATAVAAAATIGLVLATLGLLLAAVWAGITAKRGVDDQIDVQRGIELQRRVYEHLSTFSSRDFTEITLDAGSVFDSFNADVATGATEWRSMTSDKRARVLTVLNFYELVATEYNSGFLNRQAANMTVAYSAIVLWERADAFVGWLRGEDKAILAQWAKLYRDHNHEIIEAERQSREEPDRPHSANAASPHKVVHPVPPTGEEIHLPGPTIIPMISAAGIVLIVIGTTINPVLSAVGAILFAVTTVKWIADTRRDVAALPLNRDSFRLGKTRER